MFIKKLLGLVLALLASAAFANVDANDATVAQLDALSGVGPALSGRIVEARKSGPFKDWADLIERVGGVGEKSAVKLSKAGLTVNGQPFGGPSLPMEPTGAGKKVAHKKGGKTAGDDAAAH